MYQGENLERPGTVSSRVKWSTAYACAVVKPFYWSRVVSWVYPILLRFSVYMASVDFVLVFFHLQTPMGDVYEIVGKGTDLCILGSGVLIGGFSKV